VVTLLFFVLPSFFFLAYTQRPEIGCLPYFHTWCGLSANLVQVWNVLHAVCWKYRMQELRKKSPSAHHWTTPSSYIFATNTRIDNRQKKLVKQQHPLHMFLQYGELWTTNGWDWFGSLRHPSKFTSWLCYCSNIVTGGQPNFARCMAVSWAGILYIYFWCSCPVMEFCQVQNSLSVQALPSPILTALLHGTPAEGVSRTFRHGTKNGITELLQRVPPIFGWAAIRLGIGPHSSLALFQNVAERSLLQSEAHSPNFRKIHPQLFEAACS